MKPAKMIKWLIIEGMRTVPYMYLRKGQGEEECGRSQLHHFVNKRLTVGAGRGS
jgi:hypothetical protein